MTACWNWYWVVYFSTVKCQSLPHGSDTVFIITQTLFLSAMFLTIFAKSGEQQWVASKSQPKSNKEIFKVSHQIISMIENWHSLFTVGIWNTRICYIHNWFLSTNTTSYTHVDFRFYGGVKHLSKSSCHNTGKWAALWHLSSQCSLYIALISIFSNWILRGTNRFRVCYSFEWCGQTIKVY